MLKEFNLKFNLYSFKQTQKGYFFSHLEFSTLEFSTKRGNEYFMCLKNNFYKLLGGNV
jgi:hypothetical protein